MLCDNIYSLRTWKHYSTRKVTHHLTFCPICCIAAASRQAFLIISLRLNAVCIVYPQSFIAESMLIMVTVLHLGKSSLPKKPITDDDVERISLCLKVLSECSPLMNDIFNKECRKSLSHMLTVRLEEEKLSQKVLPT